MPGTVQVYVGRPSSLGNPFVIGKDGTRADVVAKYRAWLEDRKDYPSVRKELSRLLAIAQKGPLELICWCAPQACHADVIKECLKGCGK